MNLQPCMYRLVGLLTAAVVIWISVAAPTPGAEPRQPNVIVFVSDDVGYGEYGFQGSKDVPTPHIDSIAKKGVRFTSGYVSAPNCSPTRAGLLTGRYQTRFGHEFNGGGASEKDFGLPLTEKTIADRLKARGYATAAIGKWHLGGGPNFIATARGFEEFYGTVANTSFFYPQNFIDTRISPQISSITDPNFYTTDAYADRAVDWIGKNKDRPFFLYLAFNAQHYPLEAPKKYLDRFTNVTDERRRTFDAMMSAMDDAVGRVLAKVHEIGQEENTLVVFLSDNGGPTEQTTARNEPLRGRKGTTLEGGLRVPFAAQWKGKIPPGLVYDHPIIQLDILPTAVAAAGGTVDPAWKIDGVDLMPYLTGKNIGKPHETLYWRFGEQWAIRKGNWKLVVNRIDGVKKDAALYNVKDDIREATDLAAKHPEKKAELLADWKAWNAQQVEPLWKPAPTRNRGRTSPG